MIDLRFDGPYPVWLYRLGLYETRHIIYPDNYFTPEQMEEFRE